MSPKRAIKYAVCLAAVLAVCAAGARPYIDIDSGNFRPYPLALTALKVLPETKKDDGELSKNFIAVVRADLTFSGYFKMLDERSFLSAEKDGVTAATINFPNWINVGAEGLIRGTVRREKQGLIFTLRLFEVVAGKQVWEKEYVLSAPKEVRRIAHSASNDLVYYFTRTRGIFDTHIAYIMKLPGREELRVMDYDGENDRVLVRNGSLTLLPSWDNTGNKILFTSYIGGGPHLYEFDMNTAKVEIISKRSGLNTGAQYSPDGSKIALTLSHSENSEIYLIDTKSGALTRLTNDWGIDTSPSWSPDGKRIAFVSTRSGKPHIYIMNADGSEHRRITFKGEYNQTPRWSPRGDLIAFTARDERNVFDIFTINVETLEITRLTQDQGNNEEPSWSPNGRYISFTSTRDGSQQIYIMNSDGSNQRRITNREWKFTTPAWQPWVGEPMTEKTAEKVEKKESIKQPEEGNEKN
ncbi:MAG: Tol-Pal system beta propeller repeat protein TolB [Myxococcota bacterium]